MKSVSKDQVLLAAKQSGLDVFDKLGEGTYVGTALFSFSENKVTAVDFTLSD